MALSARARTLLESLTPAAVILGTAALYMRPPASGAGLAAVTGVGLLGVAMPVASRPRAESRDGTRDTVAETPLAGPADGAREAGSPEPSPLGSARSRPSDGPRSARSLHTVGIRRANVGATAAATALGIAAFAAARLLGAVPPHTPVALIAMAGPLIAAVAEEAFFRRLVYGWLSFGGPLAAIGGSALLFAAIHVPEYGPRAFPVDLAAGLLLGWQRWVTGGWAASCLTHVAANLFQML